MMQNELKMSAVRLGPNGLYRLMNQYCHRVDITLGFEHVWSCPSCHSALYTKKTTKRVSNNSEEPMVEEYKLHDSVAIWTEALPRFAKINFAKIIQL